LHALKYIFKKTGGSADSFASPLPASSPFNLCLHVSCWWMKKNPTEVTERPDDGNRFSFGL
ncbi:hypothetical protein V4Y02_24055, partial [Escherichia coli]